MLGLIGGALASAEVQAFEDDGSYEAGFHWAPLSYNANQIAPTREALCSLLGFSCNDLVDFGDGTFWPRGESSSNYRFKKYPCGFPYAMCDFGSPSVDCPDVGTPKQITTVLTGYKKDGVYHEDLPEGGLRITIGGSVSAGGCGYVAPLPGGIGDGVKHNSRIDCSPDTDGERGQCFRFENLVATGEALAPLEGGANSFVFGDPEYPTESDLSNDTRESGIEKTSTEPVSEVIQTVDAMGQPVDLTVTRQTETTIERRGDGSSVETQDDISIITQSDGITKTTTETTTTTTHPDGSKTVETTENISYTQFPENVYTVDGKTNLVKKTEVPGGTAEQTVTTTKTVDPTGNVTSETKKTGPVKGDRKVKTKNDDPNQKAKDLGKKKETCTTNPLMPKCIGKFKETAKGKFEDISSKIVDAQADFETSWNDIRAEASSKLGFTLSGGGALQQHIVDIRGVEGDIGITRWVPYFDEFGLAALVMAAASLYATIIMFRG